MIRKIHKDDFDGNIQYGGANFHTLTKRTEVVEKVLQGEWGKDFFISNNGALSPNMEFFEDVKKCPNCGFDGISDLLEVRGLGISLCPVCDFGFQNPRFRKEKLHLIYGDKYIMDDTYSSVQAMELDSIKFKYGIQRVKEFADIVDDVLDVGCGPGFSLAAYKEAGIQNIYGLDPGKYENNLNYEFNIDSDFTEIIPRRYSNLGLITLWDVLEHIHDFKAMLTSAYTALRDNGLMLIMAPNLRSLATTLIRENSPTFQIDHLNYFTETALAKALEDAGFECVVSETVISEIDNCRNFLNFQPPYTSSAVARSEFSWLTPEYIHANKLGSRLFFIAHKNSNSEFK